MPPKKSDTSSKKSKKPVFTANEMAIIAQALLRYEHGCEANVKFNEDDYEKKLKDSIYLEAVRNTYDSFMMWYTTDDQFKNYNHTNKEF